ncbi:ribonuclease H-like protein [Rhizophagus irregularis]|nr:ribonuclease H-like protein [Rhizophagus irregularis]
MFNLSIEFTDIRHQLKSLKNIEYYTDGSLANRIINNNDLSHITDNTTVDLGAAFYTNNELGEFSVYSCLSLWPSSTRAEIVAIFLALLTAPENSNVTIYTDSLGAINSINSAFNSTTRTWLKKTNNLIIIKIIMLIREAAINLKLVKIKGHSGITGNDIADKLAKKGQCGNNLFRNNVDFINNILSYFPVFIDNPIEVNIRRFILKILATGEATEWSLLKNNQELCYGNVNQIDWKVTWLIFHYCKGFHCISMRLNYLWTFIAKLFHKILPLGSILAIRKPRLYKEMKCIMKCNKKENWNHLFECEDFIRRVLQNILGVTAKSEKFQKFQQLALEVKVENFLTTKLQKDFKISLTEAQTLMANILIRFILAFKELIWKPRCEQVILWEKRRGISRTDKITSESKGKDNSNQPSESKHSSEPKAIKAC